MKTVSVYGQLYTVPLMLEECISQTGVCMGGDIRYSEKKVVYELHFEIFSQKKGK